MKAMPGSKKKPNRPPKTSATSAAGPRRGVGEVQPVQRQAKGYYSQGREAAQQFEQSLEGYVQEKPIQALLIAAGVGLLLGVLWKRADREIRFASQSRGRLTPVFFCAGQRNSSASRSPVPVVRLTEFQEKGCRRSTCPSSRVAGRCYVPTSRRRTRRSTRGRRAFRRRCAAARLRRPGLAASCRAIVQTPAFASHYLQARVDAIKLSIRQLVDFLPLSASSV